MTTKEQFISQLESDKTTYQEFPTTFSKDSDKNVDHPNHYRPGTYEAINVINAWELNFSLGNAVKYICRAGRKDPNKEIEDLKKAIFYIQSEIDRIEADHK
jgi:hypothetical protein